MMKECLKQKNNLPICLEITNTKNHALNSKCIPRKMSIHRSPNKTVTIHRSPTKLSQSTEIPTKLSQSTEVPTKLPQSTIVPTKLSQFTEVPTKWSQSTEVPTNLFDVCPVKQLWAIHPLTKYEKWLKNESCVDNDRSKMETHSIVL